MNPNAQIFFNSFTTIEALNTTSFWVNSFGVLAASDRYCLQYLKESAPSDIEY